MYPIFALRKRELLNVLNIEPYSTIGLQLAGKFKGNMDAVVFESPAETNAFFETPKESLYVNTIIETLLSKLHDVSKPKSLQH